MQYLKYTFWAVLIFASGQAAAQDCNPVRLDEPGGTMHGMPIRDQDSTELCYSYVAAQMVDAHRFRSGDKNKSHMTSPLALAVHQTRAARDTDLEFDWPHDAIKTAFRRGSCSYDAVSDKVGQGDLKGFLSRFQGVYDKSRRTMQGSQFDRMQAAQGLACCALGPNPFNVAIDVEKALEILSQDSFLASLEKLVDHVCDKQGNTLKFDKVPDVEVQWGRRMGSKVERERKFSETLRSRLNNSNSGPVGINFCVDILSQSKFSGWVQGVGADGKVDRSKCRATHSAVVVGRRTSAKGSCQYLVRNSYGASCQGVSFWDCDKGTGQIWINEEQLVSNMSEAFYIR